MKRRGSSTSLDPPSIVRFQQWLLGKSVHTKDSYIPKARGYLVYLEKADVPLESAGPVQIVGYLNEVAERWHKEHPTRRGEQKRDPNSTLKVYRCAILGFHEANDVDVNERKVQHFKVQRRQTSQVLSPADVNDMVQYAGLTHHGSRDHAMLSVFAYFGLRSAEVRALTREHLLEAQPWQGAIFVKSGKEAKDRMVRLAHVNPTPPVFDAIRKYLHEHREIRISDPLFPLSRTGVWHAIKAVAKMVDKIRQDEGRESDLGSWVHPHAFRHAAITYWKKTYDGFFAQRQAGHASVSTTEGYIHITENDMVGAIERAARPGLTFPSAADPPAGTPDIHSVVRSTP